MSLNEDKNGTSTTTTQENPNASKTFFQNILDKFNIETTTTRIRQQPTKIPDDDPSETGWDRIRKSWDTFNRGEKSIEMDIIINSMSMAAVCGFTLGAFSHNREVFQSFVQKHNTNVFQGQHQANRALTDTMFIELFKRSTKHAVRYGLFSGTFVGLLTMFATYRNDIYYSDCALSGAVTGACWKAHLGPRAVVVNATVGSLFGITFAAIIKFCMNISGTSIKQMRLEYAPDEDLRNDTVGGSFLD